MSHTHPFNGPFSRTTQLSRYQKGKTSLDFTEARDSELQWHQLGHMQVCTSLQIDNHASTPPFKFFRPDALPATQPTESKHWRQRLKATDCSSCHVFHNRPGKRNRSRVSTQWLAEEQYGFDTVMHSQLSLASLRGRLIEYQLWLGYRRKCHLCRVAGNTVWSYMACEFP